MSGSTVVFHKVAISFPCVLVLQNCTRLCRVNGPTGYVGNSKFGYGASGSTSNPSTPCTNAHWQLFFLVMRRVVLPFFFYQFMQIHSSYVPLREYSGVTFFDRWGFYSNVDNTTWGTFLSFFPPHSHDRSAGNVTFVDPQAARAERLVRTNSQGNAIIQVDNSTIIPASSLVHRDTVGSKLVSG